MELRRLGDALLRYQVPPFAFLIPAIPSRSQSTACRTISSPQRRQMQYSIVGSNRTTTRRCVATSAAATSTALAPKPHDPSLSPDWFGAGTGRKRDRRYPLESILRSSPEDEALMNNGNSADDLISSINKMTRSRGDLNLDAAGLNTSSISPNSQPSHQVMRDVQRTLADSLPAREKLSLTPRTGRTCHVTGSIDVAKGFRILGQNCARNKIKQDFNYQRFHERGGLKRKRLKSQRWRKGFLMAFKTTISRVKQLTAQGW